MTAPPSGPRRHDLMLDLAQAARSWTAPPSGPRRHDMMLDLAQAARSWPRPPRLPPQTARARPAGRGLPAVRSRVENECTQSYAVAL